ncbi:chemotaxis protein CheX [Oceanotoga sp. DSM 15011]|uniref:chemotaxis protein CheX n=1 Tax=Oceanotoga sp. DSM 15011 TaxID=2984951 RepID=UPI0021F40BAC|nr:chemotaxis protein CheX [Oceanotoga sp. DSM 15011]UYO99749.1 chemotaxis protein CheX [Oceanotoga sp. DSM 15011]
MDYIKNLYKSLEKNTDLIGLNISNPVFSKSSYHTIESDNFIIVGIAGKTNGIITLELDEKTLDYFSESMIPDESMRTDYMTMSAISEFLNMVSGNFLILSNLNDSELTPPISATGKNIKAILNNFETKRIYFSTEGSEAVLSLSLR